ncbi:MAG: hypothetical protein ACRCXD_18240 [Luteolibacter sp.]
MTSGKWQWLRCAGGWAMTTTWLCAGNFVAPAEGPVAFRRDQIPLDAETMAGLSRQLVVLTHGLDGETAPSRRAAAQMLALAIALDPGNNQARSLIAAFESGKRRREIDAEQLQKSRDRLKHSVEWLDQPEAGSHGQALAACLTDVISASGPDHSRDGAERGAWKDWIANVTAFEPAAVPEILPQVETLPEVAGSGILLERAEVSTVVWTRALKSPEGVWKQKIAPLQMTVRVREEDEVPFSITVGSHEAGEPSELGRALVDLLKSRHGTLPAGAQVVIHSPDLIHQPPPPHRQSVSAAAAVLADAAVSGREPDAVILGMVDETGAFKLPFRFWDQLLVLEPGNGRRLILPTAAAEYLPCMLALENPQIFFDYEILLAANFEELVALSAKTPDEPVAKSMASFREIREKAAGQPVGQYVANIYVRRRLIDLAQVAPAHFSAKMLAMQSAGNRPVYVTRPVLASELRLAIEPMAWMMKAQLFNRNPEDLDRLGPTYELCRARVDRLIRYVSKEDRAMLDQVQGMVTGIRTMDRAARSKSGDYDQNYAIVLANNKLLETYQAALAEITAASGEAVPPPGN